MKADRSRLSENVLDCRPQGEVEPFVAPRAEVLSPSTWFHGEVDEFIAWSGRVSGDYHRVTQGAYLAIQSAYGALSTSAKRQHALEAAPPGLFEILVTRAFHEYAARNSHVEEPCIRLPGEPAPAAAGAAPTMADAGGAPTTADAGATTIAEPPATREAVDPLPKHD